AVVRKLLNKNHEVSCMVREGCDMRNLDQLPVEVCHAELTDRDSIRKALNGCDTVFHLAADYRLWVPDPDAMYTANVEGTRNLLLEAADNSCVEKVVYTSSVATLGLLPGDGEADETTKGSLNQMVSHYKRSKFLAEQEVDTIIRETELPVVIVNPSTPIGPGDIKPTPTGRIVYDAINGRIPAYVDTGLNIVHVDDVAEGTLLALEKGKVGDRYILGGENLSLKSLLTRIAEFAGRKPPVISLSHALVLPVAYCMEFVASLSGREPMVTVDAVKMSRHRMYFRSDKARRELGYNPRPVDNAIEDAINWFRKFRK
ncbi:MAG: NAD-dependent epimerase/dehydratase family protein, partial [Thiotrichales bacterium]|nr:NAD-dependent epimerase/dehydratase family protein [Thiotrichales bacterium]